MRINPVGLKIPYTRIHNTDRKIESPRQKDISISQARTAFPVYPLNISFKGYAEDREFIETAENIVTNTMDEVRSYYIEQEDSPFVTALSLLKEKNPSGYEKLLTRKDVLKKYELAYNNFSATTLNALDEVWKSSKILTDFWMNNNYTGQKKTADIVRKSLNISDQNITDALKNAGENEYKKVKNDITLFWFESVLKENPVDDIQKIKEENKKLFAFISEELGEEKAKRYFISLKNKFYDDFENTTLNTILNKNVNNESKAEAFVSLMNYIEYIFKKENPEPLEKSLDTIFRVQWGLKYAAGKESMLFAKQDFVDLYRLARDYWKENDLPVLINKILEKDVYIINAEKQNPKIHKFQNYELLTTDEKYFVSKYYEYQKNNSADEDFLQKIINDRNIIDPAPIIDLMNINIEAEKSKYFEALDDFYNIVLIKKMNSDTDIPERAMLDPNDKNSFVNIFIYVLSKSEEFQDKTTEEKLNYLASLTKNEMIMAAEKIKHMWLDEELGLVTKQEVRNQAYRTSIALQIQKELEKVNVNLADIKIQLHDISLSVKDLLDNKRVINNATEASEITQQAAADIAEAEREYYKKSPEEQKIADNDVKATLPGIVTKLIKTTNDEKTISELKRLDSICRTSKNPAKDSLALIKTIIIGRSLSLGVQKGGNALNHLLASHSHAAGVEGADSINQLTDTGVDTIGGKGLTGVSGGVSLLPAIDPSTLAIVAAIATVTAVVSGVKKAINLESEQRPLYFELQS